MLEFDKNDIKVLI